MPPPPDVSKLVVIMRYSFRRILGRQQWWWVGGWRFSLNNLQPLSKTMEVEMGRTQVFSERLPLWAPSDQRQPLKRNCVRGAGSHQFPSRCWPDPCQPPSACRALDGPPSLPLSGENVRLSRVFKAASLENPHRFLSQPEGGISTPHPPHHLLPASAAFTLQSN